MTGAGARTRMVVAMVIGLAPSACTTSAIIATAGFGALQTGTEAFIRGELEAAVAHSLPIVFKAAQDALKELEFPLRVAKLGEHNGYVLSRETQGRKIDISLEMKSPQATKINIRVGVFGDQAISRLILAHIQGKLEPALGTGAAVKVY